MLMDCTVRDVCLWLCMKCSQFTEIKNGTKTFQLTSKWQINIRKVHEKSFFVSILGVLCEALKITGEILH